MVNTLNVGDRVLVNKLAYKFHDIHRGDVVVFKRPPGEPDPKIKDLIKRVIGLPGDTLVFKDCSVFIDGQRLDEPYVDQQCTDPPQNAVDPDGDGSVTVPDGMLFVMGDNRGGSFDSRYFGAITEHSVVGPRLRHHVADRRLGLVVGSRGEGDLPPLDPPTVWSRLRRHPGLLGGEAACGPSAGATPPRPPRRLRRRAHSLSGR